MKRVAILVLVCVSIFAETYAQCDFSGVVKNQKGELLEGAQVVLNGTYWHTITNDRGVFSFSKLPEGSYHLVVTYLGYKDYSEGITVTKSEKLDVVLEETSIVTEEVVINGIRAKYKQPATFTVLNKSDIKTRDLGQDIPYLLDDQPSVVTTSDGGTGVGYTYMRIRGLDSKKINVTINGIPYNDAESHGTYWVDVPDLASSVRSIQIQRGLGKSASGPGSFGASINIETDQIPSKAYARLDNSIGSYNTLKNSIQAGTGLINGHWFADGRFSRISSDGYIDRASSKLRSYFGQAGYRSEKSIFRVIAFGGFEETYQAWYGIDSASIETLGRTYNWAGYYTKNGNEYFYSKEVDHYQQNHVQLNYSHSFTDNFLFNTIFNYTHGAGYYQEYYDNAAFGDYSLISATQGVDTSDLAGRKWLDNNLLAGNTFLSWKSDVWNITAGLGFSKYFKAKHFGEIIWSDLPVTNLAGNKFYQNEGDKVDVSPYLKVNYVVNKNANLYFDINYRYIQYKTSGLDNEFGSPLQLDINKEYNFINPMVGVSYSLPHVGLAYATFAISHREPTRDDFVNNYSVAGGPKPENMYNSEIGIRNKTENAFYEVNFYVMKYRDELIKTGQIDDVGNPILRNAGNSLRMGVELNAGIQLTSFLTLKGNIALSKNKTDFGDYLPATSSATGEDTTVWVYHKNVDISYSPKIVTNAQLLILPVKNLEIAFINKYVGKQYLDNTQSEISRLNAYMVNDLRVNYKLRLMPVKELEVKLLVSNLFNTKYNSNGYMWGDTPYYFPQALRNYLIGLTLNF